MSRWRSSQHLQAKWPLKEVVHRHLWCPQRQQKHRITATQENRRRRLLGLLPLLLLLLLLLLQLVLLLPLLLLVLHQLGRRRLRQLALRHHSRLHDPHPDHYPRDLRLLRDRHRALCLHDHRRRRELHRYRHHHVPHHVLHRRNQGPSAQPHSLSFSRRHHNHQRRRP